MTTIGDIISFTESRFPLQNAAEWDRPGMALGSASQSVKKVLLSVDVTPEVVKEASEISAQLIISHHPPFLRGVYSLDESSLKGAIVADAIRSGVGIYAAHTNADFATAGVSETLGKLLGLENFRALTHDGEGLIGDLPPTSLLDYARAVAKLLPSTAQGILVQGAPERIIRTVGLVAGAGDSYLDSAASAGLDLFITSDLRHHPSSDFRDQSVVSEGPALMSIPHFAAEWPWLEVFANELRGVFSSVEFVVSEINTDPWTFAVMQ